MSAIERFHCKIKRLRNETVLICDHPAQKLYGASRYPGRKYTAGPFKSLELFFHHIFFDMESKTTTASSVLLFSSSKFSSQDVYLG